MWTTNGSRDGRRLGAAMLMVLGWAAVAARAAETSTQAPPLAVNRAELEAAGVPIESETPSRAAAQPSAFGLEMRRILDAEKQALAALQARFAAAADEKTALAVQQEIQRVKFDTEIALLRVQANQARSAGNTQSAREIESAIEAALQQAPRAATSSGAGR